MIPYMYSVYTALVSMSHWRVLLLWHLALYWATAGTNVGGTKLLANLENSTKNSNISVLSIAWLKGSTLHTCTCTHMQAHDGMAVLKMKGGSWYKKRLWMHVQRYMYFPTSSTFPKRVSCHNMTAESTTNLKLAIKQSRLEMRLICQYNFLNN